MPVPQVHGPIDGSQYFDEAERGSRSDVVRAKKEMIRNGAGSRMAGTGMPASRRPMTGRTHKPCDDNRRVP